MSRVRALLFRTVPRVLGWVASRSPRVALLVSDAVAPLWALTTSWPSDAALRSLFPAGDVPRIQRRIRSTQLRTYILASWIRRRGVAPARRLVRRNEGISRLQPPMIIGTFHVGPVLTVGVLSEWVSAETLVLRGPQFAVGSTSQNVTLVEGTDQQRAATFHRAIERLTANGFVLVALDPQEAPRITAPFFGGTIRLARGPFAMARIRRVPIVPIVTRWDGAAIDLVIGDPLPASDDEQALAASAAQWLEQYLREWPGEISSRILELMDPWKPSA
jgi:hypothetical protein